MRSYGRLADCAACLHSEVYAHLLPCKNQEQQGTKNNDKTTLDIFLLLK